MKRDGTRTTGAKTTWLAAAGCAALLAAGVAAWGQESSGGSDDSRRQRPSGGVKSGSSDSPRPRPSAPPLPEPGPSVPIPRRDPPPLGTRDRLPDPPPPRERPRPGGGGGAPDVADGTDERSATERARDLEADARDRHGLDRDDRDRRRDGRYRDGRDGYEPWRRRRPLTYYEPWVYDDRRYYDDGYRGNEPPAQPEPATAHEAADGPAGGERPGALLPPDELMEDPETPAALRKALDASPQYREATAQLLRAWATYARAAEQVLLRLRPSPEYRKAMQQLRAAEKKVEAVRERDRGAPAVNLVSAAQEALLARRQVRAIEQKAIDADPAARRAREEVDKAIEQRNKIRDDIAASLPAEDAK